MWTRVEPADGPGSVFFVKWLYNCSAFDATHADWCERCVKVLCVLCVCNRWATAPPVPWQPAPAARRPDGEPEESPASFRNSRAWCKLYLSLFDNSPRVCLICRRVYIVVYLSFLCLMCPAVSSWLMWSWGLMCSHESRYGKHHILTSLDIIRREFVRSLVLWSGADGAGGPVFAEVRWGLFTLYRSIN